MSDSLSHSCPTCPNETKGKVHANTPSGDVCSWCQSGGDCSCPDCYGGYPKAAVERAAKVIADFFDNWCDDAPYWPTDDLMIYNHDIRKDALAAIRAFHNEGSEG